eukprot:5274025-Pleurochrysis_carterae.AAC.1
MPAKDGSMHIDFHFHQHELPVHVWRAAMAAVEHRHFRSCIQSDELDSKHVGCRIPRCFYQAANVESNHGACRMHQANGITEAEAQSHPLLLISTLRAAPDTECEESTKILHVMCRDGTRRATRSLFEWVQQLVIKQCA